MDNKMSAGQNIGLWIAQVSLLGVSKKLN